MNKTIVIETGPLVALGLLKLLPVLPELFDDVYVTSSVLNDAILDAGGKGSTEISLAWKEGWIISYPVKDIPIHSELEDLLDTGFAESIYLAKHTKGILLTDDSKAKRIAKRKGIKVVGLPALLICAYRGGFLHRIKPALVTLSEAGYKFSPKLISSVLKHL